MERETTGVAHDFELATSTLADIYMERETRFELATSTLARLRSTN